MNTRTVPSAAESSTDERPVQFNFPVLAGTELANIAALLADAGPYAASGRYAAACEAWLRSTLGAPHALLVQSCTMALEMSALLCGIGPGDEVIMPSYTFTSTANAFVLRGAVPVFVDIRRDTLNIDERLIEPAITTRTRAIVIVHYGGQPCQLDSIVALARAHGLRLIEDAAHAFLSECDGRKLGTVGDIGCLSFHETKKTMSGEGGALLVNAPDLRDRADVIAEKGTNRRAFQRGEIDRYTWMDAGFSSGTSEINAAFLLAQLRAAPEMTAQLRRWHALYRDRLEPLADVIGLPLPATPRSGNANVFPVLTRSAAERHALHGHLGRAGIQAATHYVPLHSAPAGRRYGRMGSPCPVTDFVGQAMLRLPLHAAMNEADVRRVADCVLAFYGRVAKAS